MRYRHRNNSPRDMTVKYAGKCACCDGPIAAGEWATYYPDRKQIGHVGGLEGTSSKCTAVIRERRDPGFVDLDRAYEDQCADICGR